MRVDCGVDCCYYMISMTLVGFNKPVAVSIVVGATNFLFGFANFAALDRYGRRVVLLITLLGMVNTHSAPLPMGNVFKKLLLTLSTADSVSFSCCGCHCIPLDTDQS